MELTFSGAARGYSLAALADYGMQLVCVPLAAVCIAGAPMLVDHSHPALHPGGLPMELQPVSGPAGGTAIWQADRAALLMQSHAGAVIR